MVMLLCRTCFFKCISFVSDKDGDQYHEEGTKDEPKAESEAPKKKKEKDKQKLTEEAKEWVNLKQCQIEYNQNNIISFGGSKIKCKVRNNN